MELKRSFASRQTEQRISELVVSKDSIAVLVGVACTKSCLNLAAAHTQHPLAMCSGQCPGHSYVSMHNLQEIILSAATRDKGLVRSGGLCSSCLSVIAAERISSTHRNYRTCILLSEQTQRMAGLDKQHWAVSGQPKAGQAGRMYREYTPALW